MNIKLSDLRDAKSHIAALVDLAEKYRYNDLIVFIENVFCNDIYNTRSTSIKDIRDNE